MIDLAKIFPTMKAEAPQPDPLQVAEDRMAEAFYGTMQPATKAAGSPGGTPEARMYPSTPPVAPGPDSRQAQPSPEDVTAEKLFGQVVPGAYEFTAPPDLDHLGLVVDPKAAAEWAQVFKQAGLSQSAVHTLVHKHLRQIYGSDS